MTFGLQSVTVTFGAVEALRSVTLDAPRGEVTAVVGADGAGKTTLLRTLAGLVRPDVGSVSVPPIDRLGFVPAQGGYWSDLTVAENVSFVGSAYGLTGEALTERGDPIIERAGLADARSRLARNLSGGMRTKLGVSLALLHEPDLLILDEPTTGVDPVSRVELWRMISETIARGAAVVMSTTYMDEAERAASVVLLGEGEVLLAGAPADLIGAMPGAVTATATPSDPANAWRVGPAYHEWSPLGAPEGSTVVTPELVDACIVADLGRSLTSGGTA